MGNKCLSVFQSDFSEKMHSAQTSFCVQYQGNVPLPVFGQSQMEWSDPDEMLLIIVLTAIPDCDNNNKTLLLSSDRSQSVPHSSGRCMSPHLLHFRLFYLVLIRFPSGLLWHRPLYFPADVWESLLVMCMTTLWLITLGIFKQISRPMGVLFLLAYAGYVVCLM